MGELAQGRLAGRTAVITGAGSGIGRASALLFALEGATVLAVDVPDTDFAIDDPRIVTCECDIARADAPEVIMGRALGAFGKLDILYNNAGVSDRARFADMSLDFWDRTFEVNLRAAFRLTMAASEHLRASPYGRLISTASLSALRSMEGLGAYEAAKAGMIAMTRAFALELGPSGVTANSILPGATLTKMTSRTLGDPQYAEVFEQKSPLGRLGQPEDIARVALFLASDDSAYMTGQALAVDGGLSIRV